MIAGLRLLLFGLSYAEINHSPPSVLLLLCTLFHLQAETLSDQYTFLVPSSQIIGATPTSAKVNLQVTLLVVTNSREQCSFLFLSQALSNDATMVR